MTAASSSRSRASKPERWLLVAIVLIAALLRLPGLGENPPGPFCDEAAIATTAYSLGTTGRDLSGRSFPLYAEQRAFERWGEPHIVTQPVYQYFAIPFVVLGGLDAQSLRLASALLGILAIPATFLLAAALFDRRVALVAAAALAISPWHLHFSRVGFEAIALPALLATSTWLLLWGLSRPRSAIAGAAGMALATYAYPAALVFVPLLLCAFALAERRALRVQWRLAAACALVFALLQLPNALTWPQRGRTAEVSIATADLSGEAAVAWLESSGGALGRTILEHPMLLVPSVFAINYATYLGPDFLFVSGDPNPRHGAIDGGVAYVFTAPLLLLGLGVLIRRARDPSAQLALGWLAAAPVAASLTTGGPHAIRAIVALPMLEIVSALGVVTLAQAAVGATGAWPARRIGAAFVAAALVVAAPIEFARSARAYHRESRTASAPYWQDGAAEAIAAAAERRADYDRVLVSPTIFDAYSFILLSGAVDFGRLDASLDLNAQLEPFGFRILFPEEPTELGSARDLLVLSTRDDVSGLAHRVVADFPFPDGSPHLRLIETGPAR